jgi:hypothetical protein
MPRYDITVTHEYHVNQIDAADEQHARDIALLFAKEPSIKPSEIWEQVHHVDEAMPYKD